MIRILEPLSTQKIINFNYNGESISIGSIGINTFIDSLELLVNGRSEDLVANFHIGRYCSISSNVRVHLNRNHDYKSVSTVNKSWLSDIFDSNDSKRLKLNKKVKF